MSTQKRTPEEIAANYPLVQDTPYGGPVRVTNVTKFKKDGSGERVIINLAIRTSGSGKRNASYSCPADWAKASKFRAGDLVFVKIEGGYVKNIYEARPESLQRISAASVLNEVKKATEEQEASNAVNELLEAEEKHAKQAVAAESDML